MIIQKYECMKIIKKKLKENWNILIYYTKIFLQNMLPKLIMLKNFASNLLNLSKYYTNSKYINILILIICLRIRIHSQIREALLKLTRRIIGSNTLVQGALPTILKETPKEFFSSTLDQVQVI